MPFVFIGKDLDKEFLKEGFMSCKCTEDLRFKVGDKVYANVGKWVEGRVIKLWDEAPLIALSRTQTRPMFTRPVDSDIYVRADCPPPSSSDRKFKVKAV